MSDNLLARRPTGMTLNPFATDTDHLNEQELIAHLADVARAAGYTAFTLYFYNPAESWEGEEGQPPSHGASLKLTNLDKAVPAGEGNSREDALRALISDVKMIVWMEQINLPLYANLN